MRILLSHDNATEELEVRELGAGVFELLQTPVSLLEVEAALGDILRLQRHEDGSYRYLAIVERPYRHFSRFIPGEYGHSRAIYDFGEWIMAHGGQWEAIMGGILLLHFPRGMKVPKVKAELRAHLERFEHSEERAELLKAGPFQAMRGLVSGGDHPGRD